VEDTKGTGCGDFAHGGVMAVENEKITEKLQNKAGDWAKYIES